ncbi:MAG TPA: hypothetical protein VFW87_04700, partial [Pirellulales bacterium]|nr:hypothetical protein [Pirellulales bacterium]
MQAALKYTPNGPALGRTAILLPGDLSRRLQAETDSGQATIVGVALDDAAQLSIGTEEFGTQIAQLQVAVNDYQSAAKMPETITLKPVGRVAGRLTAAMASDARGAKVRMTSTPDGEPFAVGKVNIVGRAETAADEDGRFKVPALAVGTLNSVVTLPKGSPLRPRLPANAPEVKEAEVTKLEIALIPGIRVAGLVR